VGNFYIFVKDSKNAVKPYSLVVFLLTFFTLLQPLELFLFNAEAGVFSNVEWAIDIDNDTSQEEEKKTDFKDKKDQTFYRMDLFLDFNTVNSIAIRSNNFISSFIREIPFPPPESKI
jgi:hypothetical protein